MLGSLLVEVGITRTLKALSDGECIHEELLHARLAA